MTERTTAGTDLAVPPTAGLPRPRLDRARMFSAAQAIGIVVLAAVILTTPGFLAGPSILSLLTTVSFIGCVAIGMTLITISGNIMSFSLGATVGATAMAATLESPQYPIPSARRRSGSKPVMYAADADSSPDQNTP